MSYIDKLYEDLQDKATLNEFLDDVFFAGDDFEYKILKFDKINSSTGLSIRFLLECGVYRIRISFADYKIKSYDANGQIYNPKVMNETERYLQYMASHYEGYAKDCINNKKLEIEEQKQNSIKWLKDVFASTHTDNV